MVSENHQQQPIRRFAAQQSAARDLLDEIHKLRKFVDHWNKAKNIVVDVAYSTVAT